MANAMKLVRPQSESEKHTRTTVDTIEITPKLVASWQLPPFQRAIRENRKVLEVVEQIKHDDGVLPGIITLGVFDGSVYKVDGQHRLYAFELTGLPVGYADVRQHYFKTLAEMSEEFVRLNSSLVRLRTDDILRGYEASTPTLQRIRKRCPFIGYDQVRRNASSPIVSMSTFLRSWSGAKADAPAVTVPATVAMQMLTDDETEAAIEFATICLNAWQRDPEYARLWSALNLMLCAWLYRRIVLGQDMNATKRSTRYTKDDFRKGMMALSSDAGYLDFLVGRNVSSRDRSPAYSRAKTILGRRYLSDNGRKASYPQPAWAAHNK